jgi:hypothetical protein
MGTVDCVVGKGEFSCRNQEDPSLMVILVWKEGFNIKVVLSNLFRRD